MISIPSQARSIAVSAVVVVSAFFVAATALPTPPAAELPNIVLVTVDTLRADRLGSYGYRPAQTPNMDALAAAGARFARAYTPVPITLPAHTVMLTGTYPMRTGMHDFAGSRLNPSQPTLAFLLRAQGYATGAVVGSAVLDSRFGLHRGFDFYYDNFDFSRLDERNLDAMERPGDQVMNEALAWLDRNARKRFLLWVHLYDPHHPYMPPAPFRNQHRLQPYDGEVAFVDAQIGRLLRTLKDKGLYDGALVVLVSDHGEGLGQHAEKTHGFFIYDTTLHVPLLFKLPAGQTVVTKVVSEPVSLVDLLPTVLQVAGVAIPREVQGRSLLPLMQAKPGGPRSSRDPVGTGHRGEPAEGLYGETYLPRIHFNWSELRGLHFSRYHFIDAPRPELYDVIADPGETRNLYSQRRAVALEMRKRLAQVIAKYSPSPQQQTAQKTGLDPALAERLKSLGYVAVGEQSDAVLSARNLPDPKDRIHIYELVSEAMADSQQGRYPQSVAKLQAALKTEKDSLPVHYLLALNYYRLKDFTAAAEQFRQVLRLSPQYALATYYLGLSYANLGDWENAIASLRRTLELDPTNFSAAFNLGAAYSRVGKIPESLAALRQCVAINPDFVAGHEALGELLLYQRQYDEAIEALRKTVALAPDNAKARRSLVKALQAKGLDAEAQEELRRVGPP